MAPREGPSDEARPVPSTRRKRVGGVGKSPSGPLMLLAGVMEQGICEHYENQEAGQCRPGRVRRVAVSPRLAAGGSRSIHFVDYENDLRPKENDARNEED